MGFLSELGGLAGQNGQQAQVAGGLMQALQQHPGGVGGLLDSIRGNGMDQHVNAWANGEQTQATPEQVQQGVGNTGLIERTAEKAGLSPQVVTMALTTLLPLVVRHFAPGGTPARKVNLVDWLNKFSGSFSEAARERIQNKTNDPTR